MQHDSKYFAGKGTLCRLMGYMTVTQTSIPDAKLHRKLTYKQVTTQDLDVMDQTAITLCKENSIPVVVFNLTKAGNVIKALTGHPGVIGTTVDEDGDSSAG